MFTLSPLPPKDYVLRDVKQNQLHSQEHAPIALPKVTQANLGKFCSPIPYRDNEKLDNVVIGEVNSQILERWADNSRAWWVDRPGKNDYFLHDVYKKYSPVVDQSYDPRFKHKEKIYYRPYQYELDCAEYFRLQKLCRKTQQEEAEDTKTVKPASESIKIVPCKGEAPFWWKKIRNQHDAIAATEIALKSEESTYRTSYRRWQNEPDYLETAKADPCQRRFEMALIGQPYRNEACNRYYQNHPPPTLRYIPKRFV